MKANFLLQISSHYIFLRWVRFSCNCLNYWCGGKNQHFSMGLLPRHIAGSGVGKVVAGEMRGKGADKSFQGDEWHFQPGGWILYWKQSDDLRF